MRRARILSCRLLIAATAVAAIGCGYTLRQPFDQKIQTVYVPVFRSRTFRRDVNLMMTEVLIKEIERRSPYKVVGHPEGSDTTLEGEINFTDKNIIVENPFNLPRQLNATMTVNVTWTDNRTEKRIGAPTGVTNEATTFTEIYNFFPEVGETSEAAFMRTCQLLAQSIVNAMEEKW